MAVMAVFAMSYGCSTGSAPETETATAPGINAGSAQLPADIDEQSQLVADVFSWETFIAMCWPANTATCGPDTTGGKSILSGTGPVVWETYLTPEQVFVSPSSSPDPWCGGALLSAQAPGIKNLHPEVQALAEKTGVYRFISRTSKSPHDLNEAVGGPLVDQNGRFVRYEVRMNEDEYNYIVTNSLWDSVGQYNFSKDSVINLPAGPTKYGSAGAMEVKAAWKVMGNGDDPSRFYTIKAIVYNDESGALSPGPNPVTLGLVGLHIARKTATQRNWVWSTFEQVDNLTKSFFNPNCDTCKVNQPISDGNYNELAPDGTPLHRPTQVTRVNPIEDPYVDSLNTYYQTELKGSVWANYELVSTQWLFFENMAPSFLANTVQETYVQGPNPPSYGGFKLKIDEPYYTNPKYNPFGNGISSSCMGCHFVATSATNAKSDFSFIMGNAQGGKQGK